MKRFLLIFFLVSCQGSPSERVAREFVEAYYVEADLPKASRFADGLALTKINEGVRLTEGQVKNESTHQPEISYRRIQSQLEGEEAHYLYLLRLQPDQMPEIRKKALLKLRKREDWKITQFSEQDVQSP